MKKLHLLTHRDELAIALLAVFWLTFDILFYIAALEERGVKNAKAG